VRETVIVNRDASNGAKILFMVAGFGLATPAASQDLSIAGRDFVASWKTLIGQTVHITGGRVYGARLDSALLTVEGGSIVLSPPFRQGELRYIVEHCAAYRGGPCEMTVTGKLQPHFGNGPELVNVKFQIPSPYGGLLDRTRFSERR
jgi:hypothetical protein